METLKKYINEKALIKLIDKYTKWNEKEIFNGLMLFIENTKIRSDWKYYKIENKIKDKIKNDYDNLKKFLCNIIFYESTCLNLEQTTIIFKKINNYFSDWNPYDEYIKYKFIDLITRQFYDNEHKYLELIQNRYLIEDIII